MRKTGAIQGDNHSFALLKNEGKCERMTISGQHCLKRKRNVKRGDDLSTTLLKKTGKFEDIYPGWRLQCYTVKKEGKCERVAI